MAKRYRRTMLGIALALLLNGLGGTIDSSQAQGTQAATLRVLNRHGNVVDALTDGDLIRAQLTLDQPLPAPATVAFVLDLGERPIASCTILPGDTHCETASFPALGWYWHAAQPQPYRQLRAMLGGTISATTQVRVAPRPVVLVHGFISTASAWDAYTRPDGFLASLGLRGYAVGDGQAPGLLQTGDVTQPTLPTHSIAENAAILGSYIAGVRQITGAEQVDVVAHSLGGLITRYYIDRVMTANDVAQLLMLGTPHGGSDCAELPAALGFYLPASLELRPAYMREIFNQQISQRRNVPMYQLAGNLISERFSAPCTAAPSDLVVDRSSSAAIGAPMAELPVLHTNLPSSQTAFTAFVAPHLQMYSGRFPTEAAPPASGVSAAALQFTQVARGQLALGERTVITINLDQVAVASFALFDPTRSLSVEVRGASGKHINLNPAAHGIISIDDPAALVHLGYGFNNPTPGPWTVTLATTAATPPTGAPYALSAQVVGGAILHAGVEQMVPNLHEAVVVTANLELANQSVADLTLDAIIRTPDGRVEQRRMSGVGAEKRLSWVPADPGLYGIDIRARGRGADGSPVERAAFLAFEVQPTPEFGQRNLLALVIGGVALIVGISIRQARRQRRMPAS